jgi:hypothetical protein
MWMLSPRLVAQFLHAAPASTHPETCFEEPRNKPVSHISCRAGDQNWFVFHQYLNNEERLNTGIPGLCKVKYSALFCSNLLYYHLCSQ